MTTVDVEVHQLVLPPMLVTILVDLLDQLTQLHDDPPHEGDPVWDRLYPATSPGADDDAAIRKLVHPDVVEQRRQALATIATHLGQAQEGPEGTVVLLDDEQSVHFLGAVNDVRLALAARIQPDLFETPDAPWPPRRPSRDVRAMLELVDHLAWLQEQVLSELDPDGHVHDDEHPDHDDAPRGPIEEQ